eukprot:4692327-Pyramimonas_sp.AAC.1
MRRDPPTPSTPTPSRRPRATAHGGGGGISARPRRINAPLCAPPAYPSPLPALGSRLLHARPVLGSRTSHFRRRPSARS